MDKIVITPGGMRPISRVHLIEEGYSATLQGGVFSKTQLTTKTAEKVLGVVDSARTEHRINRNLLRSSIRNLFREDDRAVATPITDRWIIYSGWLNELPSAITHFQTTWIVPAPPATDHGQLIYLFNGIENSSFDAILQPVLQWGESPAGGGSYWAIANWYVGSPGSGIALHGPLRSVAPGDKIEGIITLTDKSANGFSYRSSFKGFPNCDLYINNVSELTWANEVLECYRLRQFSDYPNVLKTRMSEIEIKLGNTQAPLDWNAYNDVTDNGQRCEITKDSSPDGIVELLYKQRPI